MYSPDSPETRSVDQANLTLRSACLGLQVLGLRVCATIAWRVGPFLELATGENTLDILPDREAHLSCLESAVFPACCPSLPGLETPQLVYGGTV